MRNILYGYVFTYVCMWVRYPGWNLINQLHLNVIEFVTLRVSRLGYVWSETWCAVLAVSKWTAVCVKEMLNLSKVSYNIAKL